MAMNPPPPDSKYINLLLSNQEIIPIPVYEDPSSYYHSREKEEAYNPLDPQDFEQFVGQVQPKAVLDVIIDAANKENRLIPNILLTGAYGHGKTTLARLIAKRHNKKSYIIDGASIIGYTQPNSHSIYIVDEAHNIPAQVTDSLNILIDSGDLRIIACTTNPGGLPAPFRSRFRMIYLEEYSVQEIGQIIKNASKRLSIKIEKPSIENIAKRSKLNPRVALNLLSFVREVYVSTGNKAKIIGESVVSEALSKLEIDELGLTTLDRKYLEILNEEDPVGIQYISSILSLDSDTVQEEIEPYLIRSGLVRRTPRGRVKVSAANTYKISMSDVMKKLGL